MNAVISRNKNNQIKLEVIMSVSKLIQTFIDNFQYLDEKGKRKGFMMFSNRELTERLEMLAINLKSVLQAVANNTLPGVQDDEKLEEFYPAIENAITHVRNARFEKAKERTFYYSEDQLLGSPSVDYYGYKKAYKNGEFEKQLVRALQAVVSNIDKQWKSVDAEDQKIDFNVYHSIKNKLTTIINDIQLYHPKEVRTWDQSYSPTL